MADVRTEKGWESSDIERAQHIVLGDLPARYGVGTWLRSALLVLSPHILRGMHSGLLGASWSPAEQAQRCPILSELDPVKIPTQNVKNRALSERSSGSKLKPALEGDRAR